MNTQDAEEFTQTLGQITGGAWRQIALAKRMGVPKALGLSLDDWVNKRLGGYIRMTVEDRRTAVAELTAEGESNVAIAKVLGVDEGTVRNDNKARSENSEEGKHTVQENQDVIELDSENSESPPPLDAVAALAVSAPATPHVHVGQNSGENEWYTPIEYIDGANQVMGSIELDPASSAIANRVVGAGRFFAKEDDGLTREWAGNVWMNPPYAQPLCADFCAKLAVEIDSFRVPQACVLVNNATETQWFQLLLDRASAVCFIKGRVKFLDPDGKPGAPLQGQAVLYVGPNADRFRNHFSRFGIVLCP